MSLGVLNSIAFADTKNVTITEANSANQFVTDTYITAKDGFNCRPLKDKYKNEYETEIIGYDLMKGIVKCAIIPKQANVLEIPRTENANRLSTQETFEEYFKNYNKSTLEKLLTFDTNRMIDFKQIPNSPLNFRLNNPYIQTLLRSYNLYNFI